MAVMVGNGASAAGAVGSVLGQEGRRERKVSALDLRALGPQELTWRPAGDAGCVGVFGEEGGAYGAMGSGNSLRLA